MTDPIVIPYEDVGSTSTGMLLRIKARDQEAWRQFVQLYGPLVCSWCRRSGLQEADISDVFQEVFRTVAGSVEDYRHGQDGGSFRGWLRTITRTRVIDFLRRQAREPRGVGGSDAQALWLELPWFSEDLGPSDEEDKNILVHRAIELVLERCEPGSREAFLRVVVGEELPEDVARDLGMTVNAVYVAKAHIRKRIRTELTGIVDL